MRPPRLYIVESDGPLRRSVIELVAERCATAIVFMDGPALLAQLRTVEPRSADAFVANIEAAGCAGVDLVAAVKDLGWPGQVVLTTRSSAVGHGFAVLPRPRSKGDWATLLDRVETLLRRRRGSSQQ